MWESRSNRPRQQPVQAVLSEDYLKQDIPVIVTDVMEDWPATDKFNMHFINDVCILDYIIISSHNYVGELFVFRLFLESSAVA